MAPTWERWSSSGTLWAVLTLAVALLVNLGDLRHPRGALWDESYYLTSTQRYLEGRAQYASHPPLGLMLIAGGAKLTGRGDPALTHSMVALKKVTGEQIPITYDFFGVRFASALCGALASLAFYAMILWWSGRPRLAALLTLPILFDNALIVQFRAAQLDGPQVLFTVPALWAFLAALRRVRGAHVAFGICVGLAAMVRLNGVLLSLLGLAILWSDVHAKGLRPALLADVAAMLAPFLTTVVTVMLVHVLVSPNLPAFDEAGSKDLLFMPPRYQAWLRDGGILSPAVLWDAAHGYWRFMLADLNGMTRFDSNGSHPLLWPIGQKTITYRWVAGAGHSRYVQMAPNLVGWWLAAAAIVVAAVRQAKAPLPDRSANKRPANLAIGALMAWYVAFMAVNVALGQSRVMYLYHYFMGLVVAYLVLALLACDLLAAPRRRSRQDVAMVVGLAVIAGYWLFFPLTYNVELTTTQCENYNRVLSIVTCVSMP